MQDTEEAIAELGNEPPLLADGRSGPPDRREVSARWLSGTFLTGVTSSVLMGVALFAALDGREQLATPPEILKLTACANGGESGEDAKTDRLSPPRQIARAKDRRRMEVSTVTKVGDRDVIRTMPFVQIKMALAAGHKTTRKYPPFDPFAVVCRRRRAAAGRHRSRRRQIYGAKAESDMSLKTVDFPMETAAFDEKSGLSADEVEKVVRDDRLGAHRRRGAGGGAALCRPAALRRRPMPSRRRRSYGVKIVRRTSRSRRARRPTRKRRPMPKTSSPSPKTATSSRGLRRRPAMTGEDADGMAEAISKMLKRRGAQGGHGAARRPEVHGDAPKVVRTSVYDRTTHILTIALDDHGQFVPATSRSPIPNC